ncbi:nuclease-related domain-containing protein [Lysinibacillus sp. SGAir0095]|uniref:nuclease-related domain-containing protein n=1 Tax=Lysinibacillus sp. SGAir0095 TaxID=2070463 RepID=UPI0010CCC786|nr:nuclease-related domain-containing protein [Lysinibacillus sp. SGAir0095]QCR31364.1 hypothetical protein C1N55_03960 [Lysinibacillus sp. SGAir0095]
MEILKRQKSSKLINLEALLRRLPENEQADYSFYMEQYIVQRKGYDGELWVDQLWNELTIPCRYNLFHSYETINSAGYSHQIDTLLLTPHFIWLIEIKNIG